MKHLDEFLQNPISAVVTLLLVYAVFVNAGGLL